MERIRKLSTIAMVIMLPMLVYFPYEALSWNLQLSFLDWGRWTRNDAWVHPDAVIALPTRIVFLRSGQCLLYLEHWAICRRFRRWYCCGVGWCSISASRSA